MTCGMMEAKIMKYIHVFSGNVAEIWQKIKIQLSFLTHIFTRAGENDSKSWFIMFTHLHLFILHKRSSSFVCQFSHQFQKSEKNVHLTKPRAEKLSTAQFPLTSCGYILINTELAHSPPQHLTVMLTEYLSIKHGA